MSPKIFNQFIQLAGHEAEAVHSSVEFDVDREALDAAALQGGDKGLQGINIRDSGFKTVIDDLIEIVRAGCQHKNRQADTRLPQFHSLNRKRHRQIVRSGVLHHQSELHGPMTVGVGFHQHQ